MVRVDHVPGEGPGDPRRAGACARPRVTAWRASARLVCGREASALACGRSLALDSSAPACRCRRPALPARSSQMWPASATGRAAVLTPRETRAQARQVVERLHAIAAASGGTNATAGEIAGDCPGALAYLDDPPRRAAPWWPLRSWWWGFAAALALGGEWWLRRRGRRALTRRARQAAVRARPRRARAGW